MSPASGCAKIFEVETESRNQQCIAQWPAKENQCNTGLLAHILQFLNNRVQCLCHYSSGAHRLLSCNSCDSAAGQLPSPNSWLLPSPKCNHCNRFCTISNAQDSRQDVLGVAKNTLKKGNSECYTWSSMLKGVIIFKSSSQILKM